MNINFRCLGAALAVAMVLVGAGCDRGKQGEPAAPGGTARVMVFGIDGGTWDVIEPMMEAGELPNLKKLYDSGLHGTLQSRTPVLSPVVWTTIFTGFGCRSTASRTGRPRNRQPHSESALGDHVRSKSCRPTSSTFRLTWPPDPIPGVMLSGFPSSGVTTAATPAWSHPSPGLDDEAIGSQYQDNAQVIREAIKNLAIGAWSPWFDVQIRGRPVVARDHVRKAPRGRQVLPDARSIAPTTGLVYTYPKDLRAKLDERARRARTSPRARAGASGQRTTRPSICSSISMQVFRSSRSRDRSTPPTTGSSSST